MVARDGYVAARVRPALPELISLPAGVLRSPSILNQVFATPQAGRAGGQGRAAVQLGMTYRRLVAGTAGQPVFVTWLATPAIAPTTLSQAEPIEALETCMSSGNKRDSSGFRSV